MIAIIAPTLSNSERMGLAAIALKQGNEVELWITPNFPEHSYINWMTAILHESGYSENERKEMISRFHIEAD